MTYWQQLFVRVAVLARRDLRFACAGMNLIRVWIIPSLGARHVLL
jgi:hypothetical protein